MKANRPVDVNRSAEPDKVASRPTIGRDSLSSPPCDPIPRSFFSEETKRRRDEVALRRDSVLWRAGEAWPRQCRKGWIPFAEFCRQEGLPIEDGLRASVAIGLHVFAKGVRVRYGEWNENVACLIATRDRAWILQQFRHTAELCVSGALAVDARTVESLIADPLRNMPLSYAIGAPYWQNSDAEVASSAMAVFVDPPTVYFSPNDLWIGPWGQAEILRLRGHAVPQEDRPAASHIESVEQATVTGRSRSRSAYESRLLRVIALVCQRAFPPKPEFRHGGRPSCTAIAKAITPVGDEVGRDRKRSGKSEVGLRAATIQDRLSAAYCAFTDANAEHDPRAIVLGALVHLVAIAKPNGALDQPAKCELTPKSPAIDFAKAVRGCLPSAMHTMAPFAKDSLQKILLQARKLV